uniref:Uncharacterized protein n=1 Tax=Oryza sativa subsp. japonica TaxID=39947 RepID=Q2R0V6_ORYSJ|nr:hypothetical protein LOC_Os11g41270 [Oryza sativa Japonica Group]
MARPKARGFGPAKAWHALAVGSCLGLCLGTVGWPDTARTEVGTVDWPGTAWSNASKRLSSSLLPQKPQFINLGPFSSNLRLAMDLGKSSSTNASLKELQEDGALPGRGTMERAAGGLNSKAVERHVGQVMISGPTTASNIPVPLCEKGAAERDDAINALPLTDIIGPLTDHQVAASLKEKVAKEASDAAAATTSGGNVLTKGRKFSSVSGHRRKTSTPSARAKVAQNKSGGASSASPAAASMDVVLIAGSREATSSGPVSDPAVGHGPPAAVLTWEELQVEMGRLLEAGAHGIGREIAQARSEAALANERADRLVRELAEAREDLTKMRELVAGNERQRQGLEDRMSELGNNLSEIRGSLRVTYTGLHQLAGECGIKSTIPVNPDEFSLTSSLAELATAMGEIPSKHAARIAEETSNGIYTGACHVLA